MDRKIFYNSMAFRLSAPVLVGVVIYLLVLMFFDSVESLADNFFSREVMFVIGLTFLFFELNRLAIVMLNYFYPESVSIKGRLVAQYLLSFLVTIAAISSALWAYFTIVEGFTTIRTELITFNGLYIFTAIFYHLYYFSIILLSRQNESRIQKENALRQSIEGEYISFKNQINPGFLFETLEIIISELQGNKKKADDLIDNLAKTYRYILDHKQDELVPLKSELESLDPVEKIFQAKYPGQFSIELKMNDANLNGVNLVPGTLKMLTEMALTDNIISPALSLSLRISKDDRRLIVEYPDNRKLRMDDPLLERLETFKKTYAIYSEEGLTAGSENGYRIFKVPLIEIEEE
ncbi:MAG: histidine kinase [Bacteroidales bacterium]|nr:histidine kinase [Bacteroidales bacterium]